MAALVAGSCIINFCAEVISAHGIGNGSSLVICCAIISDYTGTIHSVGGSAATLSAPVSELPLTVVKLTRLLAAGAHTRPSCLNRRRTAGMVGRARWEPARHRPTRS